jgi:uncharacterized membrane protein
VPNVERGRLIPNGDRPGVVTTVDEHGLLELAKKHDLVIEVVPAVGDFVPRRAPLMRTTGRNDIDPDELREYVVLDEERMPGEDAMFGFRQLVDIAVRALSPGINDPTTAVQALDQIHDLLRSLATRRLPSPWLRDDDGRVRVVLRPADWDAFVHLAFDEVRRYGRSSAHVMRRLRAIIDDLATVSPPARRLALRRQRELLDRAVTHAFADAGERALARAADAHDA